MLKRQPRIGEHILFPYSKGGNRAPDRIVIVTGVKGDICDATCKDGSETCFIWRHPESLNTFAVNLDDTD